MHGVAPQEVLHVRQGLRHIVESFRYPRGEDRIGAAQILYGQAASSVEVHSLVNDMVVPDPLLRPGYLGAVEVAEIHDQLRRLDFLPLREVCPRPDAGLSLRDLALRPAGGECGAQHCRSDPDSCSHLSAPSRSVRQSCESAPRRQSSGSASTSARRPSALRAGGKPAVREARASARSPSERIARTPLCGRNDLQSLQEALDLCSRAFAGTVPKPDYGVIVFVRSCVFLRPAEETDPRKDAIPVK